MTAQIPSVAVGVRKTQTATVQAIPIPIKRMGPTLSARAPALVAKSMPNIYVGRKFRSKVRTRDLALTFPQGFFDKLTPTKLISPIVDVG